MITTDIKNRMRLTAHNVERIISVLEPSIGDYAAKLRFLMEELKKDHATLNDIYEEVILRLK